MLNYKLLVIMINEKFLHLRENIYTKTLQIQKKSIGECKFIFGQCQYSHIVVDIPFANSHKPPIDTNKLRSLIVKNPT